MPLELSKVHIYEKVPGTAISRLSKVNPYVRISMAEHPPILVQKGRFYGEGGDLIAKERVPDSFWKHAINVDPKVAAECGLVIPQDVRRRLEGSGKPAEPSEMDPAIARRIERAKRSSGTRKRGEVKSKRG